MQKHDHPAKVALITGAARRIGAEIARTLHLTGMNIVLHYNSSEEAAVALCNELNQIRDHSAVVICADLQQLDSIARLIKQATEVWHRLDVLVNNASRFYRTGIGKVTEYAWEDLMYANLRAPFFLAQEAAPWLSQNKGCIINITDIHAHEPLQDYSVYCISKCGLDMMTKVLAKELGPCIRVNSVAPGAILWPEGENSLSDEYKQKIIKKVALQRAGEAQDIAKTVLFLVEQGKYITGQIIAVDGGRA
jgi:pteridine reductase